MNPAWVATYTGFEVQIDENAEPDGADRHRTGAIYAVPTGAGGLQSFQAATLRPGDWNDIEIAVRKHRYTVSINGRQTADFTKARPTRGPRSPISPAPARPLRRSLARRRGGRSCGQLS